MGISFFTSERYRKLKKEFESELARSLTAEEKRLVKSIVMQEMYNDKD